MSIWYRTGTVSVTNGSTAVAGTATGFVNQVKAGDRITFDAGSTWYEIAADPSTNTSLALVTAYAGTTVTDGAYAIDRSSPRWTLASDLALKVAALLAAATHILQGSGAPSSATGADGDMYFRTDTPMVYGPKAGGAWPSGIALNASTQAGDGSASSPGVTFSAQATNGLFRPSSGVLGLAAGGTERLRLDSTGGAVSGELRVQSAANKGLRIIEVLGTTYLQSGNGSSGTQPIAIAPWFMGTPYFFVAANGMTGIMTSSPQATMDVAGGIAITGARPVVPSAGAGIYADYNGLYAGAASIFAFDYGAASAKPLALQGPGGNVGIGTSAPSNKLSVQGIAAPETDNAYTLGTSGRRWSTVYAATGTINTSDEREKDVVAPIDGMAALAMLADVAPFLFRWKVGGVDVAEVDETYEADEPVTETVTETYLDIEITGGVAREVERTRRVTRPVADMVPLMAADGEPRLDAGGNQIMVPAPRMHKVTRTRKRLDPMQRQGSRVHAGASAQQVRAAMLAHGLDCAAWGLDDRADPSSRQHLRPDQLVWILWAAVRSLADRVAALEAAGEVQA